MHACMRLVYTEAQQILQLHRSRARAHALLALPGHNALFEGVIGDEVLRTELLPVEHAQLVT